MKLPSSAIALTLMFGTILVNAPIQPVTAGHSPTEDKQSFDNRPERVSKPQVCRVQPCEHPILLASPQPEMSGNEPNEPPPFINNFHTDERGVVRGVVRGVDSRRDKNYSHGTARASSAFAPQTSSFAFSKREGIAPLTSFPNKEVVVPLTSIPLTSITYPLFEAVTKPGFNFFLHSY